MEQERQPLGDLPPDEAARAAEFERLVNEGLERARQEDRLIDHLTAKRIAQELDPGSGSLHTFAETGAVPEGIDPDLLAAAEVLYDSELSSRLQWIGALADYISARLIRSALPGWDELGAECDEVTGGPMDGASTEE